MRLPASTIVHYGTCLLVCGTHACAWTSSTRGDALETQLQAHDKRLRELERADLPKKVAELESLIERATRIVARASADTGAEVDTLQTQVAELEGRIAELQQQLERTKSQAAEQQVQFEGHIERLARRTGLDLSVDEAQIPPEPEKHYQVATDMVDKGEHSRARALLRAYVEKYPDSNHSDDAQWLIGVSYLKEDRPATALGEFRKVLSEHAEGDHVDKALWSMAEAFWKLHACSDAKAALRTLLKRTQDSKLRRKARQWIREMQRTPASYCSS